MSPKVATVVIVIALALFGAAWMLWAPSSGDTSTSPEPVAAPEAAVVDDDQPMATASIYFPGDDGWLHATEIDVPAQDGEARVRALVNALLSGPAAAGGQDGFLWTPLPVGTRLDGIYFLGPGSVALDLRPEAVAGPVVQPASEAGAEAETPAPVAEAPPAPAPEFLMDKIGRMGSTQEMLTVYSLVNTVAMGSEAVERVVLLIDGKQPTTLAGHVDLTRPLRPDTTWINAPSP